MNIKEVTEKVEIDQYADTPLSGRGDDSISITLKDLLPNIKTISLRKPFAMIVGSVATQGKSNNDIDIVVRREESSDKICMSRIPFSLRGNIDRIIEKSEGRRIIAGYANVAVVDSDEQFIPVEVLSKGITSLLNDPHYSNLMLVHQSIQIGKIIAEYKDLKTHVDDKGLFIVAEIRNDLKTADEIWESILNNEINGFSIGCEVIRSHDKCDDKQCITILDEINIFEVSVCTKPVNEESGFIIVSKSKLEDVCESCKKQVNDMSKKETLKKKMSEEPENTDEKTVETSEKDQDIVEPTMPEQKIQNPEMEEKTIEERISDLDRRINAIEAVLAEDNEELPEKPPEEPPQEFPQEPPMENEPPIEEQAKEKPKEEEEEDTEEPSKYPYPKKAFDDILEQLTTIVDKLSEKTKEEEIKMSIKSRDDLINSLKVQIKELSKDKPEIKEKEDEGKPKTIQNETTEIELEKYNPIRVEKGTVYYKE